MGKFSKFLFLSAMTGAAAYGAYYYLRKEEVLTPINEDEDSTDFEEDLDGEPTKARSYINLTFNKDKAEDLAKTAVKKARETLNDSVQKVEEFFNDEPATEAAEDIKEAAEDVAEEIKEEIKEKTEEATEE